jgi:AcrR family transcriptional regulator
MPRRGIHSKEELGKLIIETAIRLAESSGLESLSARKIAKEINYTHGTVHQFYDNFNDVILKVNADTLDQIYTALYKAVSREKVEAKDIYALASTYIDYGLNNRNRWKALYEFNYPREKEEELPDWYQERVEKIFTLVESRLVMYCDSPKNVKLYSQILWSSLHGIAMLALTGKLDTIKIKSVKKMTESFIKVFVEGLKTAE